MSWTIERNPDENDAAISKMERAIKEAQNKKILMLCSASDQGSGSKTSFPGSTHMCIRIGSGTEHGDRCSWVHQDDFDFCFPGENVPLQTSKDGPVKMYNGSSVATAIATGSVGLLLYLNKLNAKGRRMRGETKGANDLKSYSAMTKVLNSMCKSSKSTNSKCPRFGDNFGGDRFNEFMFMLQRGTFNSTLGQIMDSLTT